VITKLQLINIIIIIISVLTAKYVKFLREIADELAKEGSVHQFVDLNQPWGWTTSIWQGGGFLSERKDNLEN